MLELHPNVRQAIAERKCHAEARALLEETVRALCGQITQAKIARLTDSCFRAWESSQVLTAEELATRLYRYVQSCNRARNAECAIVIWMGQVSAFAKLVTTLVEAEDLSGEDGDEWLKRIGIVCITLLRTDLTRAMRAKDAPIRAQKVKRLRGAKIRH